MNPTELLTILRPPSYVRKQKRAADVGEGVDAVKHRAARRRNVTMGLGATAGVAAIGDLALGAQASTGTTGSSGSAASGALTFDKDAYTELTTTITTDDGEVEVKYHFYKAITYVTKPVDETYQSLNVSVPVEIDGKTVDATNAPILFANSVGGHLPSSVAEAIADVTGHKG
jgi:hypothetical protein